MGKTNNLQLEFNFISSAPVKLFHLSASWALRTKNQLLWLWPGWAVVFGRCWEMDFGPLWTGLLPWDTVVGWIPASKLVFCLKVLTCYFGEWSVQTTEVKGEEKSKCLLLDVCFISSFILSGNQFLMCSSEQRKCLTKQSMFKCSTGNVSLGMDNKYKWRIFDDYQPLEIYCTQVGWSAGMMEVLTNNPDILGQNYFCRFSL